LTENKLNANNYWSNLDRKYIVEDMKSAKLNQNIKSRPFRFCKTPICAQTIIVIKAPITDKTQEMRNNIWSTFRDIALSSLLKIISPRQTVV
jgi:hypothetical protein